MKHVTLMLALVVLLSGCATHRPCIEIPAQKAPNLSNQGFTLSLSQDKKFCELGRTLEQQAKGVCGDIYDVMADREIVLKADGQRSRDLITSISCK